MDHTVSTRKTYQSGHSIDATIRFAQDWGDSMALDNLKKSDKASDVHKAESENHLKGLALRFERQPNQSTLKLWAEDMVNAGYEEWMVKEVCKSAPFKFEKHPTLSQLMELLRPYRPKLEASDRDELNDLQDRCYYHLKTRFIKLTNEETFNKMVDFYAQQEPELKKFNRYFIELCVLGDWLRSYLKDGAAILNQRLKTIEACKAKDREYFLRTYRSYAKENRL